MFKEKQLPQNISPWQHFMRRQLCKVYESFAGSDKLEVSILAWFQLSCAPWMSPPVFPLLGGSSSLFCSMVFALISGLCMAVMNTDISEQKWTGRWWDAMKRWQLWVGGNQPGLTAGRRSLPGWTNSCYPRAICPIEPKAASIDPLQGCYGQEESCYKPWCCFVFALSLLCLKKQNTNKNPPHQNNWSSAPFEWRTIGSSVEGNLPQCWNTAGSQHAAFCLLFAVIALGDALISKQCQPPG